MRPTTNLEESEPGVREYLASVGTTNPQSIKTYVTILGSVRARSSKALLELDKKDVQALVVKLKEERSYSQYVRRLRAFYKFHERDDLVKYLPKVKAPDATIGPDDILGLDEISLMLEGAASKRDRALIVTLFETGGRISEVLSLNVEDLTRHENGGNDGKPWFRAWFKTVKIQGEQHYGYIREAASVACLDAWLADYPSDIEKPHPLFPSFAYSGNGRLTRDGADDLLKAAARNVGIVKRIHPHIFRHSAATALLRAGQTEGTVKRALGWSASSKMLSRYSHLANADIEAALGLSGEKEKPAELLIPKRNVPAMAELPFKENPQKAVERLRAELRSEVMQEMRTQLTSLLQGKAIVMDGPPGTAEEMQALSDANPGKVIVHAWSKKNKAAGK